ncbi:MAG: DNA repair protein RecO, partial [Gammaproteobacteria bacterium]
MRVTAHHCFVLHQRSYRETSLLLDVFSAEHGRTAMVARGARRGKSAQALILQPYHKLMLSWVAHNELGTLTSVESAGINYQLTGSQSFTGFYINELTLRLLDKQESHGDLFVAYENALQHLVRDN